MLESCYIQPCFICHVSRFTYPHSESTRSFDNHTERKPTKKSQLLKLEFWAVTFPQILLKLKNNRTPIKIDPLFLEGDLKVDILSTLINPHQPANVTKPSFSASMRAFESNNSWQILSAPTPEAKINGLLPVLPSQWFTSAFASGIVNNHGFNNTTFWLGGKDPFAIVYWVNDAKSWLKWVESNMEKCVYLETCSWILLHENVCTPSQTGVGKRDGMWIFELYFFEVQVRYGSFMQNFAGKNPRSLISNIVRYPKPYSWRYHQLTGEDHRPQTLGNSFASQNCCHLCLVL